MDNLCTIGDYTFTVRQDQQRIKGENATDYVTRGGVVHLLKNNATAMCSDSTGVVSRKLSLVNCIGCARIVVERMRVLQGRAYSSPRVPA